MRSSALSYAVSGARLDANLAGNALPLSCYVLLPRAVVNIAGRGRIGGGSGLAQSGDLH